MISFNHSNPGPMFWSLISHGANHADISKATQLLGFMSSVGFEEGMRQLAAWSRDLRSGK